MIKLIAAETSATALAGSRQDQASRDPGVWRVTARHARLSVVSCRQRSGVRRSRRCQIVERANARELQMPRDMVRASRRARLWSRAASAISMGSGNISLAPRLGDPICGRALAFETLTQSYG
jgi:hypothetical protein